jgi:hypothetical protein
MKAPCSKRSPAVLASWTWNTSAVHNIALLANIYWPFTEKKTQR